jgi:hypothetical protein
MDAPLIKDGDAAFNAGLDSASDPLELPPTTYGWSVNMLNRGGILQARPGFNWKVTLPSGKLQGMEVFVPDVGTPVILVAVAGVIYASSYPYADYRMVEGARMSPISDFVHMVQTVQSVESNTDGSLSLINPRQLMIIQDGAAPPAYFDGQRLNVLIGAGSTPQGTHMVWAGARLWVSRGPQIFASDIANPLSFMEQTYNTLGGINYFLLPGPCTGMALLPGNANNQSPILAFTAETTTMFQANILNRALWPTTAGFQNMMFPNVGCVSRRSIVSVAGLLWWFSEFGLTRLDAAQASQLTTRLFRVDNELVRSESQLSDDLSGVAGAAYENFILMSTPSSNVRNRHTWVYDATVAERLSESANVLTSIPSVWASLWTGVFPVAWTALSAYGSKRLFCVSSDTDGQNRIYEAFCKERRDNGCDFPWSVESRAYTGGSLQRKHLRYLEYALSEMSGNVTLKVSWAGANRGRWKSMSARSFRSHEGNLDASRSYKATDLIYGLKKQSRTARTQDIRDVQEDSLTSAGIEGPVETVLPDKEAIDSAFQFRVEGSGPCALRSLRAFMDLEGEPASGQAEEDETDDHFVRFDGAASNVETALDVRPVSYTGVGNGVARWNNFAGNATATVTSFVSQVDADKRAAQVAQQRAEAFLRSTAVPYKAKGPV